ncbi:hypothetical protein MKK75_00270 [Methylobacterium sp. J-030]|uniref:hypothetical protein n=1 Tax=Methylobacterium sp. J-030 TaxID=2836627 RepID=UPI001FBAEF00|nr:hypothetical protein [Methylobacterium sp. J-030]MCJ2067256.1 hypothetical protein [Methylobacterium sp. J-030]
MSVAILAALIAGALCLGMLSMLVPLGRQPEEDDETFGFEDEFFDLDGPVIDMEPAR